MVRCFVSGWRSTAFSALMISVSIILGSIGPARPLRAQDASRLGINLGITTSPQVGLTFDVSEQLSVRPTLRFDRSESDQTIQSGVSTVELQRTATTLAFGFDVFARVAEVNAVRLYVGAGGEFLYQAIKQEVSGVPTIPTNSFDESDMSLNPHGFFGLRAPVTDQISVFGELVISYLDSQSPGSTASIKRVNLTTSALGILIFVN